MGDGGWSTSRLGRLHDVLAGTVERGDVPGLVAAVSRRGELHVAALGTLAVGGQAPMQRDTIFRITSMTKPIAAVAALILVEECVLRLDDPIDHWLPELANRRVLARIDAPLRDTVPAQRAITLRDLLTFRLGLGLVMAAPGATPFQRAMRELELVGFGPPDPSSSHGPDDWIQRLGTLPLLHQPGERWMYNTGSCVLGVLLARASGQPLERLLRERIFDPLGMKDTGFHVPAEKRSRFATEYRRDPATGALALHDRGEDGAWTRSPAFPDAAAGLVSTVDDYLAFARMLLANGKHGSERILSRLSIEAMTTDQITPAQKAGSEIFLGERGWGFGVAIVNRRDDVSSVPGRYGWDGGFGTSWASDPKEELIGILLTQAMWTSPVGPNVARDFWTSTYQAIDD